MIAGFCRGFAFCASWRFLMLKDGLCRVLPAGFHAHFTHGAHGAHPLGKGLFYEGGVPKELWDRYKSH